MLSLPSLDRGDSSNGAVGSHDNSLHTPPSANSTMNLLSNDSHQNNLLPLSAAFADSVASSMAASITAAASSMNVGSDAVVFHHSQQHPQHSQHFPHQLQQQQHQLSSQLNGTTHPMPIVPAPTQSSQPLTDAASYLRLVQSRTSHDPETFQEFLELLRVFREHGEVPLPFNGTSRLTSDPLTPSQSPHEAQKEDHVRNMAERVVALLHPYPDLVLGFNQVRLRL
jgi:histone deacetylase complex regulatory component SIN3